ncbi:MAG: CBS domain-containing protein [Candidatus Hydrogenedens sp.]|nr:CBS domain-containing protein [Candidatus Hydrogenedens sp.]
MQTIRDVLKRRDTYWVEAGDTVRSAVRYLCERKTGAVAVKEGDEVVGVFSERDLMHKVVNEGRNPDKITVRDVMTSRLISIGIDDEIHLAKAQMYKNRVRHLLVLGREEQFKGLVSMRDLVDADIADSSELIHRLNDHYYQEAYKTTIRFSSNRMITQRFTV